MANARLGYPSWVEALGSFGNRSVKLEPCARRDLDVDILRLSRTDLIAATPPDTNPSAAQIVNLTAPLGTWKAQPVQTGGRSGETRTYLSAERIARKMRNAVSSLGVDLLLCITNQRFVQMSPACSVTSRKAVVILSQSGRMPERPR